ncbi:MAG TPA: tRNA (N6-threonylcarbamoyladenosine(37)-N6)-methyltransferase TrmO [Acidimicrobiia bacterium]|nr:tRNA (N6-threonylcarbamoyladenosine(37)-N6)-methyltransferase TrmO [Acidimicrobiia bacterium]
MLEAVNEMHYELRVVGIVESALVDVAGAPAQGDEGGFDAWIAMGAQYLPAMRDLVVGERVIVLTWLDRGDREVLAVHPRGDPTRPRQGVFSTRSPDRPNPIGLHEVEILAIDGTRLHVRNLEAISGTPVLDVKPVLGPIGSR